MEYYKIVEKDLPFVEEMLALSQGNDSLGRGYPKGEVEGLTHEFSEFGSSFMENFYVIGEYLGIFGIFDAPWGLYIIGPTFQQQYHTVENVATILKEISRFESLNGRTINITVVEANGVIMEAVKAAGFEERYRGVAMEYDLNKHVPKKISEQIIELTVADRDYLEQVNQVFAADLKPWGNRNMEDLFECLEDKTNIAALLVEGKVAGAIVWSWERLFHEGELEYVCVKKEFQRQGYGKSLLDYATNKIYSDIALGEKNLLFLDTDQSNIQAKQFYLKYTFKVEYYRRVFEKKI